MKQSANWIDVGRYALLSFATARPEPSVAVVSISGELDPVTTPPMAEEIDALRRTAPTQLIVNMSAVSFLSARGVRMLRHLHAECRRTHVELVVVPSPVVRRVVTMVGLADILGDGESSAATRSL